MKQVLNRFVALVLLVLVAPLIAVLAVLVLGLQGRPVMFRQARSGLHGKPFILVKFRSMRHTRDAGGELLPDEQRVTRIGTFLRKTRLDELPSLWNVVKGDLAFVGPRPLLPETIAGLGELGMRRGLVPPGLTGWAQINGNTLLTLDQKVALDLWYVENRTLKTDCAILVRTLWVMAAGEKLRSVSVIGTQAGAPRAGRPDRSPPAPLR